MKLRQLNKATKIRCKLSILHKSRHMRRWLVQNPWIKPMSVFNYATILIQKVVRGFLARRRIFYQNKHRKQNVSKKRKTGKQLEKYMSYLDKVKNNATKPNWLKGGFSAWCAVRLQASCRMYLVKRKYLQKKRLVNQVASIIIQTFWRNVLVRYAKKTMDLQLVKLSVGGAARKLQMIWRSFCNRRIFKYFRDLVMYKLNGAPVELLRAIIPNEAALLDRAAGIHVKFRLGGWIFPPKVYFKIFTHRPLCDVNAFAPRDYTKEFRMDPIAINNNSQKRRILKNTGIKVGVRYFETIVSSTNLEGTQHWYRREDNNDWRPISSHKFEAISTPPWFQEVNHMNRPKPFHYSRMFRQQDISAKRKKKKREWMMKLYQMAEGKDLSADSYISNDDKLNDHKTAPVESKRGVSPYKVVHKSEEKDDLIKWRYGSADHRSFFFFFNLMLILY